MFCLHWNQSHRNGDRYKLSLLIINALCSDQAGIIFNKIKCEWNIESFFSIPTQLLVLPPMPLLLCRSGNDMDWVNIAFVCLMSFAGWIFYFCLASGLLLFKYTQCLLHFKWELTAIISLNDGSDGKICSVDVGMLDADYHRSCTSTIVCGTYKYAFNRLP